MPHSLLVRKATKGPLSCWLSPSTEGRCRDWTPGQYSVGWQGGKTGWQPLLYLFLKTVPSTSWLILVVFVPK